jgi:hypothetical protein
MVNRSLIALCLLAGVLPMAGPASGNCPSADEVVAAVDGLDLSRSVRVAIYSAEFPPDLRRKAASKPGRPVATHEGNRGFGALVVSLPVERLWMAVNDEEHHAGELPVRRSEVIAGTPRGASRTIFQYFKRWGVGRWWVSRVTMNRELFESSQGRLWELHWEAKNDSVDRTQPPVSEVADKIKPLKRSSGAWLMVPLGGSCTLVEYYNYTDPGGALQSAQLLMINRSIRSTLKALTRLAEQHVEQPHDGPPFVRPDGSPIE